MHAAIAVAVVLAGWARPVHAQVPSADQACINAFNKGLSTVAKAQGKNVRKCLSDFASGKLVGTTPEACLVTDLFGRVSGAINKAVTTTTTKCTGVTPGFGTTPINTAVSTAGIIEIDLMHGAIGQNLDNTLIPSQASAACQSKVAAALLKCSDQRKKVYLKCMRTGLTNGTINSGSSLESVCLGTANATQPDPLGKLTKSCVDKVAATVSAVCSSVNLQVAFPACNAPTPAALASCLTAETGCQLCRLMNSADGLARDCDRFDDGNGSNGTCGAECGDGIRHPEEGCDDGDLSSGDGCSSACAVEVGWTCTTGSPSVCTPACGNGILNPGETCDDGNTTPGDGCSSTCAVESGYTCAGQPSTCTRNCGNGVVSSGQGEACDDGDASSGDGCSSSCQVEPGWVCSGQPSVCTFVCGNGTFQAGETCDDGDATSGDGCSNVCQIEPGWLCSGQPSFCTPICGDGKIKPGETCDDGDATSNDGCSLNCQVESGYACVGEPSNCVAVCGDGFIRGNENCDDGNTLSGDGCSGTLCRREVGFACAGQPSVCIAECGDGNLDGIEECDDGNLVNGDGCNSNCRSETGYACGGQPSVCVLTCGNGAINAAEQCDDGNVVGGDGCSASCKNESGYLCPTPGLPCTQFQIFIDTPAHGVFTTAGATTVTGHYTVLPAGQVAVTVNGVPASSVNQLARTFSHTVALDGAAIFNPIRATLTNTANGDDVHDRITVIRGQSVADGAFSPQSVAMRINDTGLDTIEPIVGDLAGSGLNLGTLLPVGTVLADDCFINAIGCWGSAQVKIANPPPSYNGLTFTADSKPNVVGANITVHNLRVDVDIDGSGLVPDCGLRLTAATMPLTGDYALQPDPGDASNIDVNLVTPIGVSFGGFNYSFTYGLCDAPIIGDIIQAFLPDIEQFAIDGIRGFLSDPDGTGPQDSPIADAIETTLAGISITGPVGAGLGLNLEAPLFTVAEDNTGITFGSDARFSVVVGTDPGECIPPPGAPNLTASYSPAEPFPSFGANTPVGNTPYGLGICISSAGFNQMLRGQTECGLMRTSLTTIDLDGPGGAPPLPITSSLLSLLAPEFGQLPPATPLRIDVAPTLAPIVTSNSGPGGELTELKIAHVAVDVVQPGPETLWLSGAFDARLGMDLDFLPDGSGLSVTLAEPQVADTTMAVIYNPLGTNEAQLETALPGVIRPLIPQLAGALSGFPLPQFFGLSLQGVEVSRNGQFLSLFANLAPAP